MTQNPTDFHKKRLVFYGKKTYLLCPFIAKKLGKPTNKPDYKDHEIDDTVKD